MKKILIYFNSSVFILLIVSIFVTNVFSETKRTKLTEQESFEYLKSLEGKWTVHNEKEGTFGWEFEVTSRGSIVIERLKAGTSTEMTTVYYFDNEKLQASHYCQLKNQPQLQTTYSEGDGDLHLLCDNNVGNTKSHDELHMHGVHFQKEDDKVLIWMDMLKDGEVVFQTSYELSRADSINTIDEK